MILKSKLTGLLLNIPFKRTETQDLQWFIAENRLSEISSKNKCGLANFGQGILGGVPE